jgi:Spy/CpxP family protein refolding chaperone
MHLSKVKSQIKRDMKKITAIAAGLLFVLCVNTALAQDNKEHARRDPKQMTERVAQKLNFSEEQKTKLIALNEKYAGADYDKEKYREEFKGILTAEQKQQMDEMRMQRMDKMKEERSSE